MTWLFFTASSVFFFTLLDLLQRKTAVESTNPRAMAVLFNAIAAVIAILLFFLTGGYRTFRLPTESTAWVALAVAALGYGLFERGRFAAAKLLDASVFSTIQNFSLLVAFVGSIFLYSESLTLGKAIGGLLILAALFLVSSGYRQKNLSRRGILIAVLISCSLGIGWMLDKIGARYFTADTYNIFVWTVPLLFIYFPAIDLKTLKHELKLASWKIFVLPGLNVIGYLLQLKAMQMAEATRVIPIVQTCTLFTVICGIVFLNERENIPRKLLAGVIAIIGVFFLA